MADVTLEVPEDLLRNLAAMTGSHLSQSIRRITELAADAVAKLPPDEPPVGSCVAWVKRASTTGNPHRSAIHSDKYRCGWSMVVADLNGTRSWSWNDIVADAEPGTLRVLVYGRVIY